MVTFYIATKKYYQKNPINTRGNTDVLKIVSLQPVSNYELNVLRKRLKGMWIECEQNRKTEWNNDNYFI